MGSAAEFVARNRRAHARRRIHSLAYADLGMDNGGILLDVGEGGAAVQAVVPISGDSLPKIRLQLPDCPGWIEASARLAWAKPSGREAGIEFTEISEESRAKIREWVSGRTAAADFARERRVSAAPASEGAFARRAGDQTAAPGAISDEVAAPNPEPGASDSPADLMISTLAFSTAQAAAEKSEFEIAAPVLAPPIAHDAAAGESARSEEGPVEPAAQQAPEMPGMPSPVVRSGGRTKGPAGSLFDRENGPDLHLFGYVPSFESEKPKRNWRAIAIIVVILAIASFAAGMAAAQGNLDGAFSTIRTKVAGLWTSVAGTTHENPPIAAPRQPASSAAASNVPLPITPIRASGGANQLAAPQAASDAAVSASGGSSQTPQFEPAASTTLTHSGIVIRSQPLIEIPMDSDSNTGAANGDQQLRIGQLVLRVDPVYPPEAIAMHIEGTVRVRATTAGDGGVTAVDVLSGESLLAAAAENAVWGWKYQPTLLDGKPVETQWEITFDFHLPTGSR